MTGDVKLEFAATTLNEAVLLATEKWRVLVEDPEATLPWSTHITFWEEGMSAGGSDDTRITKSMCSVTIEFDRKLVDELTGAMSAGASA
jgi:hypothetical protein